METLHATFERVLTARDCKQNIPFIFRVPADTGSLSIRFSYAPPLVGEIHNLLTLTVFDPTGWRGAGHRHGDLHEIAICGNFASPGFLPGPIQAGVWTIVVDTHMIMPGPDCTIRLEVTGTGDEGARSPAPWPPGYTASRGAGWYRGDLHAHSIHSDAAWDIPGLVAFAHARRLDFATLSDHNTVSGLAQMDAACSDELLTIGGMELTTFWGHALALGLREWTNWRTRPGERSMEQIEAEVTERGGLFIIAHPMEIGDPYCTGCNWLYPGMMPGTARVVEVWNGNWVSDSNNEDGLRLVYDWLNQGCRLALTAGTDNHGHNPELMHYGYNVVNADALSEIAILRAVRAGRLYLSSGPELKLSARAGRQHAGMGGVLDAPVGTTIQVQASWKGCALADRVEWIVDGKSAASLAAGERASQTWEIQAGEARWCLATLRRPDGQMLALTNPIYLDGRVDSSPSS